MRWAAAGLLVVAGCAHRLVMPETDTWIRIERSTALGAPLDYELTLYDDGLLTYANRTEKRSGRVPKEEVKRLIDAWEKLGDPLGWGCDEARPVHESPGATVTVSKRGVKEQVKHDTQDTCVHEGLWALEDDIDAVGRLGL